VTTPPAVLVHGNPETPALWDPLVACLQRDVVQPAMAEAGRSLEAAAAWPGLALLPSEDAFVGSDAQRRRAAGRAGARVEVLDGLGHWWMVEDPQRSAAVLERFWATL
jgi:pimeloyl-ACP methyl ester carboxylesterase